MHHYFFIEEVLLPLTTNRHCMQVMVSELMVALEFVQAYISDLSCITKSSSENHLIRQVLIEHEHRRLKVHAKICSFCITGTEYLGYLLTREGIKPQPEKVHVIIVLTLSKNLKQGFYAWS